MKLHKLAYFIRAYSMALRGEPLFAENVLAGGYGPVIEEFFEHHQGIFMVTHWPLGNRNYLSPEDKVIADYTLKRYAHTTGKNMGEIAMSHLPWVNAYDPSGKTSPVMDLVLMRNYYRALFDAPANPKAYAERFMDRYENTDTI